MLLNKTWVKAKAYAVQQFQVKTLNVKLIQEAPLKYSEWGFPLQQKPWFPCSLYNSSHPLYQIKAVEKDSMQLSQPGGQLNSLSIVSISSSSDPSYRMTGMVREVLWQLPKVLGRVEKRVNSMVIKTGNVSGTRTRRMIFLIGSTQNIIEQPAEEYDCIKWPTW